MKGFLVVDRLNDIHFIETDKEFARHINEQAREQGLISDDEADVYTVDPNIVMQQFSPLFMSQWFMIDHAKNPCSSIICENDFLFVFRHFEDFLIVAINGDNTESEDFLTRKTLVFIRLIGFVMGPVSEEIGKPRFTSKMERWNFLRHLLSTWTYLAKHEQSFLVEAVEKLHMNQVVSEQCVEILQAAVNKFQEAGERHTQHALLLVNSKLLSLYSNRNAQELQSSDILCIILLVRCLFPTHDKLEDLFAQSYRRTGTGHLRYEARSPATVRVSQPQRDRYESAVEGFTTGDETENDEYFSAKENKNHDDGSPSPLEGILTEERSSDSNGAKTPYPEVSEKYVTPTTSPTLLHAMDYLTQKSQDLKMTLDLLKSVNTSIKGERMRSRSHTLSEVEDQLGNKGSSLPAGRGRSSSLCEHIKKESHLCSKRSSSDVRLNTEEEQEEYVFPDIPEDRDCIKQAVFLSTSICKYSPYQIHCQRIFPGIILVVLTEMPKLSQAPKLVQLMQLLKDLMNGHKDMVSRIQGQIIYDAINTQLTKVLLSLRKAKGQLEKLCTEIRKKWESDDVRGGILAYLEQSSRAEISPSLERSLKYLYNKLTEVFRVLYLSPRPLMPAVTNALISVTELFTKHLGDYRNYLIVKAQRNFTMTTYIEDFPGLVHFIYVNRRTNQIMAPSLNITQEDIHSSHDATQLLKEKIWGMTGWIQQKLHEGYTTVTAREGDYHYSYFLWFENCSGSPEVIQRPYKADCTAPPPGILTGNFYKYITHKCFPQSVINSVHCIELFMMHVGLANMQFITNHCRELAARLYETSGDMVGNIGLFGT
ncbi:BLOC-3 complex member HPS1-like [Mercenaria mercenaria]|uniref:BLOC-3 complex member HPS1-like n=1 Tax=Mercenaria mercenaria TaxID=6596 RepID=UPI00234E6BD2|nr:BLOC-3 complex member HPS1-like [Mercenaria mercenaria]